MDKLIRLITSALIIFCAIYLDGYIDAVRSENMKSIFLDAAPNLIAGFFIPASYFSFRGVSLESIKLAAYCNVGLIIYELVQIFDDVGVFDIYDLIASVFCFFTFLIWFSYLKWRNSEARTHRVSE